MEDLTLDELQSNIPKTIFDYNDIEYSDDQRKALTFVNDCIHNFRPVPDLNDGERPTMTSREIMLNGYAGTGKTTIVKNIVHYLLNEKTPFNSRVLILAPTNKAVQVLATKLITEEVNNIEMSTLHAALYGTPKFDKDGNYVWVEAKPISNALIVVDEASMLNQELINSLHKVMHNCLILYCGDNFQLEPIGDDPKLFDRINQVKLSQVKRVNNNILTLATAIRTRKTNLVPKESVDNITVYGDYDRPLFLNTYIDTFKSDTDSVIVVATNDLRNGLNEKIREKLGRTDIMEEGDKLISISNSHDFKNGDMIMVDDAHRVYETKLTLVKGQYKEDIYVYLYDVLVGSTSYPMLFIPAFKKPSLYHQEITSSIGFNLIKQFESFIDPYIDKNGERDYSKGKLSKRVVIATYGYAISCHKSQGSEFRNVFVNQDYCAKNWNAARWFYTAITRSRANLHVLPNSAIQRKMNFDEIQSYAQV